MSKLSPRSLLGASSVPLCTVPGGPQPIRCPCLVGIEWSVSERRLTLGGVAVEVSEKGGHFVSRTCSELQSGTVARFYGQMGQRGGCSKILVGVIKITEVNEKSSGRMHIHFVFMKGPSIVHLA